ncbi:MAG: HigA family addiction module antidote protein [Proteobacteria bacterium]|nr:HigA family addiction module antidote protein [Pseudomonadota bacterium]
MLTSKIHPGIHLKELLAEYNISQSALARHIQVKPGLINEICNGKRGISVEIAQSLAISFGNTAEFWLNLQIQYELGKAKKMKYSFGKLKLKMAA